MNLFDQVIHRTEAWLQDLDLERDAAGRLMAKEEGPPSVSLITYVLRLEKEREDVIALLAQLQAMRKKNHPALLFSVRPKRMLKVPLRRGAYQRRKATA